MTEAEEKLKTARLKLFTISPFFSYLALYLKIKPNNDIKTIGVSGDGEIYYNEKWIGSLSLEECIGVLCHEIMHLSLLHMSRRGSRKQTRWNCATDLVINYLLVENNFSLPKGGLIPNIYGDFYLMGKKIENINKKSAEQIYDEIPEMPEMKMYIVRGGNQKSSNRNSSSGGGNSDIMKAFDEHIEKAMGDAEKNEQEEKWLGILEEAYCNAKTRGKLPLGIERFIDDIKKSQINWKSLLQKYLQALIPSNHSWMKRSKKSISTGFYLPSYEREHITVIVSIDTSGSIGKKELTDFISEILGLARAYKDKIDMKIMTHDVKVHDVFDIRNGNIDKIKNINIKGGGGTSHYHVFETIKETVKDCKVLISFTDGYSDLSGSYNIDDYPYSKIFVINKDGSDEQLKNKKCLCVKIK